MNYFDDLILIWGNENPDCRAVIDRRFETIYSVQLSLGGPLSFGRDRGTLERTTGPLFFWHHPSHSYQYHSEGGRSWHHLWVSFRGARARRLLEEGFMQLSPAGFIAPGEMRWAAETMRDLIRLTRSRGIERNKAVLLLEELLLWAREEAEQNDFDQSVSLQKVRDIAERIRERPDRQFNFSRAAARAGLSTSHFRALFRQVTGRSPYAYLLHLLMERAATDLARTRLSVAQIGQSAGYSDPVQFSKAFKKSLGCSPETFRIGMLRE